MEVRSCYLVFRFNVDHALVFGKCECGGCKYHCSQAIYLTFKVATAAATTTQLSGVRRIY